MLPERVSGDTEAGSEHRTCEVETPELPSPVPRCVEALHEKAIDGRFPPTLQCISSLHGRANFRECLPHERTSCRLVEGDKSMRVAIGWQPDLAVRGWLRVIVGELGDESPEWRLIDLVGVPSLELPPEPGAAQAPPERSQRPRLRQGRP